MKKLHQSFSLSINYDVVFTKKIFSPENNAFIDVLRTSKSEAITKVAVVIDKGLLEQHPDLLFQIQQYFRIHHKEIILCAAPLVVLGGEEVKNETNDIKKVLDLIHTAKIDRHSYIVAIGGGAVLDMVGFVASIAHRGIRLVRIPTTVLSQNDSSVGVKNGVNYFEKKNFIGTFVPPFAVINDSHFLTTLDERDWRSGIAEAVKVALIKDASFFDWIVDNTVALNNFDLEVMETLVYRCAQHHLQHIASSGDPFESGSSRPLDFGHWAAHKLEQLSDFEIRHGEAVAIGIALDVCYSYVSGYLNENDCRKILTCFQNLGFNIFHPLLLDKDAEYINPELLKGLEEFREHLGGKLTIMLIKEIGVGFEVHEMKQENLQKAVLILMKTSETHEYKA